MPLRQIVFSLLLFASLLIAAYCLDSHIVDNPGVEPHDPLPSGYFTQHSNEPKEPAPFLPREYIRIKK
ncbi:hypothetical protein DFP98_101179 [Cohnella phaseoli]|uniref:Uncharacterized protein n=1 Tax=Cohnella phaseoli TaxID=456490 RepID=A0A3D9KT79_9BACL|nr:hypothetical protein DFP98_101179 [Cohnella phaseoli]